MNTQGLTPGEITSTAFPPSPPVHWIFLVIASCVLDGLIEKFIPHPYSSWLVGLSIDGWAVYFCIWLRRLDRKSIDYRWFIALVAAEVLAEAMGDLTPNDSWLRFLAFGMILVAVGLYLPLIFSIRSTLLRHYNQREPVGLTLGPWMTFFFSFYYFQYHLYPIAQFKDRVARGDIANPGRSLLS